MRGRWDPFNVTEYTDQAVRLAMAGVRSQRSAWDKTPHGHELAMEAELARHDHRVIAAPA